MRPSVTKSSSSVGVWVERLSEHDLPVMAGVLTELKNITEDTESSAIQFSEIILKDASLTSQVLKAANCAFYNPVSTPISTVSRAVVQLGTSEIKRICVSVLVIEQFLQGNCREQLTMLLANAFHIATQAKNLFEKSGDNTVNVEEVVIAGLLLNLGDMAFWSFADDKADELSALIKEGKLTEKECEKKVIGITLKTLTLDLCERWGLGKTLHETLSQPNCKKESSKALQIGSELTEAIDCGWQSNELDKVLKKISKHYDINYDEARELAVQGAEEAANFVLSHGANQLCHLIPSVNDSHNLNQSEPLEADAELQLNILRELATMAQEKVGLNTLFNAVLEGMHRGVGFERAAIALLNKEKTQLTAKYVIRQSSNDWQEKFILSIENPHSVFSRCLESKELIMIDGSKQTLLDPERAELKNNGAAILAPILVGQRLLGVYYADRGGDTLELDKNRKDGFQHFYQQANMCLAMIASKQ